MDPRVRAGCELLALSLALTVILGIPSALWVLLVYLVAMRFTPSDSAIPAELPEQSGGSELMGCPGTDGGASGEPQGTTRPRHHVRFGENQVVLLGDGEEHELLGVVPREPHLRLSPTVAPRSILRRPWPPILLAETSPPGSPSPSESSSSSGSEEAPRAPGLQRWDTVDLCPGDAESPSPPAAGRGWRAALRSLLRPGCSCGGWRALGRGLRRCGAAIRRRRRGRRGRRDEDVTCGSL